MKDEYIKNSKGAVMTYFKVLSQPPPEEIEKTSVMTFSKPAQIQTVYPQDLISRTVLPVLQISQPQILTDQFKIFLHSHTHSSGMLFLALYIKCKEVTSFSLCHLTMKGDTIMNTENSFHIKVTVK
jgi:hypothetical protein